MTITQQNYLDLAHLLIYEFIGDVGLFTIICVCLIAYIGAKQRIPITTTLMFEFICVGLIVSFYFNALLWALGIFIVGVFIYAKFPKLLQRT